MRQVRKLLEGLCLAEVAFGNEVTHASLNNLQFALEKHNPYNIGDD